jgi:NAD+ diphosphatase
VYPLSFDQFTLGEKEPEDASPVSRWFIFKGTNLLVSRAEGTVSIPLTADAGGLGITTAEPLYLGVADGHPCRALEAPEDMAASDGWSFEPIRSLFGLIGESFFTAAARALQLLEWNRAHRWCGSCGAGTRLKPGERARECTACGELFYPRISPAVIVAVVRGDRLLLARAQRFPTGFYSVLAGFAEPGETLEQCVQREVREETGIEVKNIRYFGSQPWPFPHSLMVAFTAEHAAGEIRIDENELVDAGWYAADSLPSIPDRIAIARHLIDWFSAGGRP